jgi:hypothetical protein
VPVAAEFTMKKPAYLTGALAWAVLFGANACGTDAAPGPNSASCNPDDHLERKGVLDVRDVNNAPAQATPYTLDISTIATSKTKDVVFMLSNSAVVATAKPVVITGVDMTETDETGAAVTSHQFECLGPDGKPCDIATFPTLIPATFDLGCAPGATSDAQKLTIRYTRPPTAKVRHVKVTLRWTQDTTNAEHTQDILIDTALGAPKLSCTPLEVDFGIVAAGTAPAPLPLSCNNLGTAPVQIQKVELLTDKAWYGAVAFASHQVSVGTAWSDTAGIVIETGSTLTMQVSLDPTKATVAQSATLLVTSNDPTNPLFKVQLKANSTGPCLTVSPSEVDLGSVGLGQKGTQTLTLTNCGKVDSLTLTHASLQNDASPGLAITSPGGPCGTVLPTTAAPWVLGVGQSCAVQVEYAPPDKGVTATGTVQIDGDGGVNKLIPVTAKGVAVSCGSACFTMKNGSQAVIDSVVPQTVIALDGGCSTAAPGQTVAAWNWTVVSQPTGSYATFQPASSGQKVTFQPNIAGNYTLQLKTFDGAGAPGCDAKTVNLVVVPDDKLHVELTWTTAGDNNTTDKAGTDMDLHLAHQDAHKAGMPDADGNGEPDPWNNLCDCFVYNKVTNWGDLAGDFNADAVMKLDDLDGWGPENINVHTPQAGFTYTVGAYYYIDKPQDPNGKLLNDPATGKPYAPMGPSVPRVRVYLDLATTPQFDNTGPSMVKGDMWCVQQVTWHTNAFVPCKGADNGVLLTPLYPLAPATLPVCEK